MIKRPRGPRSSLKTQRPHIDLRTQAVEYYLHYHLQAPRDVPKVEGGLSQCITAWKVSARSCAMVDLALSTMALAVYSRIKQYPAAATAALSIYHRLLQVVQARVAQLATSKLNKHDIDSCLLSVSLMGRYEGATHRPDLLNSKESFSELLSWSHHDGALAILKAWNDCPSHKPVTYIIKQTRRGLIRSCLIRNLTLPDWMVDGTRFGEEGQELTFDHVLVRIVNLRHAAANLQQTDELLLFKAETIASDARELDIALEKWTCNIPMTCSPKRHIISPGRHILPIRDQYPKEHFYSSTVYSYPKPENAGAWAHFFAVRMLINSTRLRVLEQSRSYVSAGSVTQETQRLECLSRLNAMAERIAASTPFSLERFKIDNCGAIILNEVDCIKPYLANLIAWPLIVASSLEGIVTEEKRWFRSELARLGRILGDGILECAETDQWTAL
jgi:hypothetical protein